MRRSLPPLTALIAFEAAARHMNFTRAAEELNVTQPAVSHQIQMLEADLGVRLFSRNGRHVALTTTGQDYFRAVSDCLSRVAEVTKAIRNVVDHGSVTIATNPGVAAFWLMPRINEFQALYPELKVRVLTSERDRNLPLEDLDIAIRFGDGKWPNATADMFMPEDVVPVCAPGYGGPDVVWTKQRIWEDPALLHQEDEEERWFTWEDWRKQWLPDAEPATEKLSFSNYSVEVLQAVAGKGLALGWTHMLADYLESGTLVAAGDFHLSSDRGYYVIMPKGRPIRDEVKALRRWLFEQFGRTAPPIR